jgi:hypothetical protein
MVGWDVNDIRIWSDLLQHFEKLDTMSLQFSNGSRWEPFRSNLDYDIIFYAKCSVTLV